MSNVWVCGYSLKLERQLRKISTIIIKPVFIEVRKVQKEKQNERIMVNICKYFGVSMIKFWNLAFPCSADLQYKEPDTVSK